MMKARIVVVASMLLFAVACGVKTPSDDGEWAIVHVAPIMEEFYARGEDGSLIEGCAAVEKLGQQALLVPDVPEEFETAWYEWAALTFSAGHMCREGTEVLDPDLMSAGTEAMHLSADMVDSLH